jgi:hypothetical protein
VAAAKKLHVERSESCPDQKRCIWIEINFEPFKPHSNSGTARIQSPL